MCSIGPLALHVPTREKILDMIVAWLHSSALDAHHIGYINPHVFNLAIESEALCSYLNQCDVVCLDGIGMSLAVRWVCGKQMQRIVALSLFDDVIRSPKISADALLVGVEADIVVKTAEAINRLGSGIRVVACVDGFQTDSEYQTFFAEHQGIKMVLIGAGTPRSEVIAILAQKYGQAKVVFHVGAGTLKVYAGCKRRAPEWLSRFGFEWLHRFIFEPHTRSRYSSGTLCFARSIRYYKKHRGNALIK